MPARDSDDPKIQFKAVGGLNERPAPHALEAPDFGVLHALYQRNYGALQRLEGTKTLALLPAAAGVLGGAQLDDGTGNVVVQGSNGAEYLYTLDELFGRTPINTLVYEPLPDDNDMPTAVLVQTATNGTDLANIGGASANTWYTRPITALLVNEDSIVVTLAANQFTLAPGTYRIRGYVTAAASIDASGGSGARDGEAGFQCCIVDTTTSATVATGSPASVKFTRSGGTAEYDFGALNLISQIDDTFEIVGPGNSVMEVQNAFSSTVSGSGTVTVTGGVAANVTATVNGAALVQPYLKINVAKIA